ncbi:MAG: D-alanyl-D-alanine carboxypeptidase [Bdellovibrionota bacterium]
MLNKFVNKPILLSFMISTMVANSVYGAKMISSCHMDQNMKEIKGTNINIKYPIASVAKLFTSLLATTTFDLGTTFSTQVFATPIDKNSHDVHITGSADPYFNRYKMQMIVSRLNEAGVKNIRNLTFDENVKYLHDTDASGGFSVVTGSRVIKNKKGQKVTVPSRTHIRPTILKATLNFPPKELVEAQLKEQRVILADYSKTYLMAKTAGIELFKSPRFVVEKTAFKAASEFRPAANTIKLYVSSQDVLTIIKSMNWNSNNHSANRLLVASGGLEKLNSFYYNTLKVSASEFSFVNGSGQNHDLSGSGRLYNEASCSVVVRTIRALNTAVQKQKKEITDIVAVMGVDKGSTVGGAAYTKPQTRGMVVAKTGTVGTNITLGGTINGTNGPHYFFYNVQISSMSRKEENRARAMINAELIKLTKQVRGVPFNYIMDNPLKDNMENYDEDEAPEAAVPAPPSLAVGGPAGGSAFFRK